MRLTASSQTITCRQPCDQAWIALGSSRSSLSDDAAAQQPTASLAVPTSGCSQGVVQCQWKSARSAGAGLAGHAFSIRRNCVNRRDGASTARHPEPEPVRSGPQRPNCSAAEPAASIAASAKHYERRTRRVCREHLAPPDSGRDPVAARMAGKVAILFGRPRRCVQAQPVPQLSGCFRAGAQQLNQH